ncbi:lipid A biosynthesis acyltransferase [Nitrogeniibacter mangrovi]|uniref:Lipid A biosynthesis acyltransferase n=1 Tax=Nitrogeniibacter mangrovi TaxID=2016596 RepID=A0A6C1AZR1_9RHOO|nr:lipid A biosynthesis acyltransferase [Nitrogeniibacter mangrovi]QID16613.1 lipid A biosynthesis acyltransferase [Nitrogeniibacter mangrovi]
MSRLFIALLWLLHWLPLSVLSRIGEGFGLLLYALVGRRRRIVKTNLSNCFPDLDEDGLHRLTRAHFRMLGRSFLERGLQWWAPRERLERLVHLHGAEHVRRLLDEGTPVILMVPHFVGLDMGGLAISMHFDVVNIYARQSNKVIDRWLYHGRSRFGHQILLPRDESIRSVVREMKAGRPFFYLPDMDHGRKDSVFVPFFGIQAATITGLPRFARMAKAKVVPVSSRFLPGGQGYEITLGEPWADYPSGDLEADVACMNARIEAMVRPMPEQYYWVHRRFKTRPEGERGFY